MFNFSRLGRDVVAIQRAGSTGSKALVAITGSESNYTDPDGCFNLETWKNFFDTYGASVLPTIQTYVNNGTILGLYATDEPHDWGNMSCGPTGEDIDEMCAHAKSRVTGLKCGVNTPPSWLAQQTPSGGYNNVDFVLTQNNFVRIQGYQAWLSWASVQRTYTNQLTQSSGITTMYLSMDIYTGSPTADLIQDAGYAMCDSTTSGILMWKSPYLTESMRTAFVNIANRCK